MNISEIKTELARLAQQIAAAPSKPTHHVQTLHHRKLLARRDMLEAELQKLERLANLPPALRARLRQYFSSVR